MISPMHSRRQHFVLFRSPLFPSQYAGAAKAGLIRGAYHVAYPDKSPAHVQASWLLSTIGRLGRTMGSTLPGMVDLGCKHTTSSSCSLVRLYRTDSPAYNSTCYRMTAYDLVNWIHSFSNTYYAGCGRYPAIYTDTEWWKNCTGDNPTFGSLNPLWINNHGNSAGDLPSGWKS
jgi:GH25 family lysozyme M1 (1,4-beta-N-acetylmuramidase)